VAVVAARSEADRVRTTVLALRALSGVTRVVVADDGSSDATAAEAASGGAAVVRSERNLGKGAALEAALEVALGRGGAPDAVLLADADLGESASALGDLVRPVLEGQCDLAIAAPPRPPTGGFGLVRRAAAWLIRRASGRRVAAPLSGQRAVTVECLAACRPLAPGFGVEAAMTADATRLGYRVLEVEVPVTHRFTRRDAAGFRHRAAQGLDIVRAMVPRAVGWR